MYTYAFNYFDALMPFGLSIDGRDQQVRRMRSLGLNPEQVKKVLWTIGMTFWRRVHILEFGKG